MKKAGKSYLLCDGHDNSEEGEDRLHQPHVHNCQQGEHHGPQQRQRQGDLNNITFKGKVLVLMKKLTKCLKKSAV